MKDFTVISYPGTRDNGLLTLTENRSRYMLPIGGKFRVVDFTIRNSFSCGITSTIIFSHFNDDLPGYIEQYGPFEGEKHPPLRVVSSDPFNLHAVSSIIMETGSRYFIFYNGDNPSIIDFKDVVERYMAKKTGSVIFGLDMAGKHSMAHKILVTDRKSLAAVFKKIKSAAEHSPNIFEMVINRLIIDGIKKANIPALYWPVKTVTEYYNLNRDIIWSPEIFGMLYKEKIIMSKIKASGYAHLKPRAKISNSFISDYCSIDGTVENSIIYPGVTIGEGTLIKDSIILPFVKIGSGSRIIKAIIDESTDNLSKEAVIGNSTTVGSNDQFIKNVDFPKSLFESITLIGKNCKIPGSVFIGGGCYIRSGLGSEYFAQKKFLYDGMSLVE